VSFIVPMTPPSIPGFWKKVLVPTDFSECSLAALKTAARLHQSTDAEITLLHVTEPAHEGLRIQTEDLHDQMHHDAQARLQNLANEHFTGQDRIRLRIVEGRPADAICATAEEEESEVIIIPTHGHSGLKHMLVGSVAEKVVRQAVCDVLVVRQ